MTLGAIEINHVALSCKSVPNTIEFYVEVLGFKLDTKRGGLPKIEIGKHTFIELFPLEQEPGGGRVPIRHFAIVVEDLERAMDFLNSRDIKIVRGPLWINKEDPDKPTRVVAFFNGPDGEEIELVHEIGD